MELLVMLVVVIYSIWSEISKDKKENEIDLDFSSFNSDDDFFDLPAISPLDRDTKPASKKRPVSESMALAQTAQRQPKAKAKKKKRGFGSSIPDAIMSHDELSSFNQPLSNDQSEYGDREYAPANQSDAKARQFVITRTAALPSRETKVPSTIVLNRNNVVQAFIMAEVLQRYDIERIYSRIPSVKHPTDD